MLKNTILDDFLYAISNINKNRATASLIIATLALGIGLTTSVFSFFHAILLRPLPYKEPDRLVRLQSLRGDEEGRISMMEIEDLKETGLFEDIAAYVPGAAYNASDPGTAPEEIPATLTTSNLFEVLGVPLRAGGHWPRIYDKERNFGIIMTEELWKRRYASDPSTVGRKILLDAAPNYIVFGITPPGIHFPNHVHLYRSIYINKFLPGLESRSTRNVYGLGRLKQGVQLNQARAAIHTLSGRLRQSFPDTNAGISLTITPLSEFYVGKVRPYLLILFGAVLFVLLIACVNVVNLLLTRSVHRIREIAIRISLGASNTQLLRLLLTESLVLSLIGAAIGIVLSAAMLSVFKQLIPVELPVWMQIEVNTPVLLFAVCVSVVTGLLTGIIPARQAWSPNLNESLKEGTIVSSRKHGALRNILVASQIALAIMLLAGAGFMLRTFMELSNTDPGFKPANILTFRIALPWRTYTEPPKIALFYTELLKKVRSLPAVEGVAITSNLPMSSETLDGKATFTAEGQSLQQHLANPYMNELRVSPSYFSVTQIRIERGRGFTEFDTEKTGRVCIVSRSLADRMWPGMEPMGKRIKKGAPNSETQWATVVGVTGNVLHESMSSDPGLDLYFSYLQVPDPNMFVLMKAAINPATLSTSATKAVWAIDRDQSTYDFMDFNKRVAATMWQRRISTTLLSVFGSIALLMAVIGIYGVTSYAVSQRRKEIGIRMTLGAQTSDVRFMVLKQVGVIALTGTAAGSLCALLLGRLLKSFVYEITSYDPVIHAAAATALIAAALLAGYLPAQRAATIDPLKAIRHE
jgi:putative ABC transport system permease protein